MEKLRVWWVAQVPCKAFYVPVKTVEEGNKVLDILAAYDAFQLENRIKPDYTNVGGLQKWDEIDGEWYDWDIETEDNYFDNVDEYCETCDAAEELNEFSQELFSQIDWYKIDQMTRK